MNNINITVQLCEEDRARLDQIIKKLDLLGTRPDCSQCVKDVAQTIDLANAAIDEKDEVQKKLAEVIARTETAKNAQDAPETTTPTENSTEVENEAQAEPVKATQVQEAPKPSVTMSMLTSKAITLSAAGKKDQVRAIIHEYAQTVTSLPEDKWGEVYQRLTALED